MYWFEIWKALLDGCDFQPSTKQENHIEMLRSRLEACRALAERRNHHAQKYEKKRRLPYRYEGLLYAEVAEYYETYYTLGIREKKSKVFVLHRKVDYELQTPKTKHKNYLHKRYDAILKKAMTAFGKLVTNDDEFIVYLYSLLPKQAFSDEEIQLWREIYHFATRIRINFVAVKRSDRRTIKTWTTTYSKFCDEYPSLQKEYSCSGRYFVPLFINAKGANFSSTMTDGLLRYDSNKECFTQHDWQKIAISKKKFLGIIEKIRETSKKSSR